MTLRRYDGAVVRWIVCGIAAGCDLFGILALKIQQFGEISCAFELNFYFQYYT